MFYVQFFSASSARIESGESAAFVAHSPLCGEGSVNNPRAHFEGISRFCMIANLLSRREGCVFRFIRDSVFAV